MFTPADFDALRVAIERSADHSDMKARLKALRVVRDCAARFGLLTDSPNNGYPFCPAPGCNRSQEPGLDHCAAHYELDADDMPNIFEPAPVRLCQECGAAPTIATYSRMCESCMRSRLLKELELAQEQATAVAKESTEDEPQEYILIIPGQEPSGDETLQIMHPISATMINAYLEETENRERWLPSAEILGKTEATPAEFPEPRLDGPPFDY